MNRTDPSEINWLVGRLMDLQEQWELAPDFFDWTSLQALAQDGARAYNEGGGPSFHALAIDGIQHSVFYERFLDYLLNAGFDPFKLVRTSSAAVMIAAISHDSLAQAALSNVSSARMRTRLMKMARERFEPLVQATRNGTLQSSDLRMRELRACLESVPLDLLAEIAPELAKPHSADPNERTVDSIEGAITTAEAIAERNSNRFG